MNTDANQLIDRLLKKRNTMPEVQDLAQAMLDQMGGVGTFAKEWMSQYTACKAKNQAVAAKMLQDFTRILILANTTQEANPVEGMSDNELAAIVKEFIGGTANDAGTPAAQPDPGKAGQDDGPAPSAGTEPLRS